MNSTDALHQGLIKMLNYLPMIYNQRPINDTWNGEFVIRYPYSSIPENALIFMLPVYSSLDNSYNSNINKLTVQYATVSQDGKTISYEKTATYNIMIEGQDGSKRPATEGDIIANKLCMFRFITNNTSDIILCNNPIYNNLQCSSLYITNEATFKQLPIYEYLETVNNVVLTRQTTLATAKDIGELSNRIYALEEKFKTGTDSPEKFFAENKDLSDDTIYFQVEE